MPYRFITSKKRSSLMRKIRSNNTKPELVLRNKLWSYGFRSSRKCNNLPGRPDIIHSKYRVAVFVDGEFWHGYKWVQKKNKIKDNRGYWIPKIERNIVRDRKNNRELRKAGWKVIRLWEHEIIKDLPKCLKKIEKIKKIVLK